MKNFLVATVVTAGLLVPMASASAESVAAPADTTSIAAPADTAPVASSSEEVFCAIIRFLKGGWAGRPADCSF
ncbi:hypothetical protein AB0L82_31890 [Nocardia sp. NPDC052001]|uniref:hypothetical protein n=1 Tax=Nocardia sp. NPDC052001 TaxID=3154853 RepID=UPI003438F51F